MKTAKKTKKERRMAILKDAIKQILANSIIPTTGTVVNLPPFMGSRNIEAKPILTNFFKKKKSCFACARGSLLLCTVHKENDFLLSDFNGCVGIFREDSVTDRRLLRVFSEEQIALMENAFEISDVKDEEEYDPELNNEVNVYGYNYSILGEKLALKAVKFGKKYEDSSSRLLAIFKNAVKNGGIFKP